MDELQVKQLVEKLSQHSFNLANWAKISEMTISDDIVVGGLVKVTGKTIKDNIDKALKNVGDLLMELSIVVGNISK